MKRRAITIATLAVLLLAGTAIAQPGGAGMSDRSGEHRGMGQQRPGADFFQRIRPMLGMLDLTDTQREDIGQIITTAMDSMESIGEGAEGNTHREDFLAMFSSAAISVAEVEDLLNNRIDAMEEMNGIVAPALVEIHNLLTADQLATLADFEPGSMEMDHGGHGRSGGNNHRMNSGVHPAR